LSYRGTYYIIISKLHPLGLQPIPLQWNRYCRLSRAA